MTVHRRPAAATRSLAMAALVAVTCPAVASAVTRSWATATSGSFTDATLWTPNGSPTNVDVLGITFAATDPAFTINLAAGLDAAANTLTFDAPKATLDVGGTLTIKTLTLAHGTLDGAVRVLSGGLIALGSDSGSSSITRQLRPIGSVSLRAVTGDPTSGNLSANTDLLLRAGQVGGGSNVTLSTLIPSTTNAGVLTLDALAGTTVATNATINFSSTSNALLNTGTLNLNAGSSFSDPLTANRRTINGRLINSGTVNLASGVSGSVAGTTSGSDQGIVENSGTFSIAADATLTTPSFKQSAGSVTGGGTISTTRFELLGGDVNAVVKLAAGGTLVTTDGVSGSGVYRPVGNLTLDRPIGSASGGDLPAGADLRLRANQPGGSTSVFFQTNNRSFTNAGTLALDAEPATAVPTTVDLYLGTSNTLTNVGSLTFGAGSTFGDASNANRRTFEGRLVNGAAGVVTVAGGAVVSVQASTTSDQSAVENSGNFNLGGTLNAPSFKQSAGTLSVQGALSVNRFELLGGTVSGIATIAAGGTLVTADLASASGVYRPIGNLTLDRPIGATAGGDVPAGVDLRLRSNQTGGSTAVFFQTNNRSFTNRGTMTLDAEPGTTVPTTVDVYLGTSNTLTNQGTLTFGGGSTSTDALNANRRTFEGRLVNTAAGVVTVGANAAVTVSGSTGTNQAVTENSGAFSIASGGSLSSPSFKQSAGTLTQDGTLTTTRFELLGGTVSGVVAIAGGGTLVTADLPSASGAYRPVGNLTLDRPFGSTLGGDVPAGVDLRLRAGQPNVGTTSVFFQSNNRSFTNRGLITLDADTSSTGPTTVDFNLGSASNTLTNVGTLNFGAGSTSADAVNANRRTFTGRLVNTGAVIVAAGVRLDVNGSPSGDQAAFENSGVVTVGGGGAIVSTSSFRQSAGTLTQNGTLTSSRFELLGGTVNGVISIAGGGLLVTGDLASASGTFRPVGSFTLDRPFGSTLGGDVPAGVDLRVRAAQPSTGTTSVFVSTNNRSIINRGALALDADPSATVPTSIDLNLGNAGNAITNLGTLSFGAGSSSSDPVNANRRTVTGRLINAAGGTIGVAAGAAVTVNGSPTAGAGAVDNSGSFNIAQNGTLSTSSFRQLDGSLGVTGTLVAGRFELLGGTVNGTVTIPSGGILVTGELSSAGGAYRPAGGLTIDRPFNSNVGGDLPAGIDLRLRANQPAGGTTSVFVSTNNRSITNRGTLTLDAEPASSAPSSIDFNFGGSSNTLTNAGVMHVAAGSSYSDTINANVRRISGNLNNAAGGTLTVDAGVNFQVLGSTLTNAGTFNLNASFFAPPTFINSGQLNLGGNVVLNASSMTNNGSIVIGSNASLNVNGTFSGTGDVTLNGGTLVTSGPQQSFGNVNTGNANYTVPAGQTVTADSITTQTLSVPAGSAVLLRPDGTADGASRVTAVDLSGGGSLDIANNLLVVTGPNQYDALVAARAAGITGAGLESSTVDANPQLDIAIVRADEIFPSGSGTILGQPVSGDDVIVRVTYNGDSNVDATVGFADLVDLAQHYNTTGQTWADGDSNYDGAVNFSDLVALAKNYNKTLAPSGAAAQLSAFGSDFAADWALAQSLVPEPAMISTIGFAAIRLLRRKRLV